MSALIVFGSLFLVAWTHVAHGASNEVCAAGEVHADEGVRSGSPSLLQTSQNRRHVVDVRDVHDVEPLPKPALVLDKSLANEGPSNTSLVLRYRQCSVTSVREGPKLTAVVVLPSRGSMFVHIFKNGGTTVCYKVRKMGGDCFDNFHWRGERVQLEEFLAPTWFRTAVVRDPMSRVVSSFNEVKRRAALLANTTADMLSSLARILETMEDNPTQNAETIVASGHHFSSQVQFLLDDEGNKLPMDYIGQLTNLQDEMAFVLGAPHLTLEVRHGPTDEQEMRGLRETDLSVEMQRAVCRLYRDDYCCFGFDWPEACRGEIAC